MFSFIRRHKIISSIIAANLVAILIVAIAFIIHISKTATLDIAVAPSEAEIRINGNAYDNFQSHELAPGSYEAVISMEGMKTRNIKFDLDTDGYYKLSTYLVSEENGLNYYWQNQQEMDNLAMVLEDADGRVFGDNAEQDRAARELIAKYREKEAGEQNLPITYSADVADNGFGFIYLFISLGDDDNCKNGAETCIIIYDTTGGNYDLAVSLIQEKGIDLNDYEIIY